MVFEVVTIFPKILESYVSESILGRAVHSKKIKIRTHDLRRFSPDKKHHKVDDRPYGGGPGMVMQVEPFWKAVQHVKKLAIKTGLASLKRGGRARAGIPRRRVLLTSAKGKQLTQTDFKRWKSNYDQLIILCGRYEGIDERVSKFVDEEVSIGPYVMTGGELAAAIIVDGVTRLIPGVLGKDESAMEESHAQVGVGEHPQYTRPDIFSPKRGVRWPVPKILKTGDHQKISEWKKQLTKKL